VNPVVASAGSLQETFACRESMIKGFYIVEDNFIFHFSVILFFINLKSLFIEYFN
jgi:hypothetical protein